MTLLTIVQNVAKNVGIEPPDTAVNASDPDCIKLLEFVNETGKELARRVDWSQLRKPSLIVGTGFAAPYNLPPDYARLIEGWAITHDGAPVRGSLTADEWNSLVAVEGAPRYFFKTERKIAFYPYPPEAAQVNLTYVSNAWTSAGKTAFEADTETALFPDCLLEQGAIWRHKRHIAADYSDYLAEFEATLAELAQFDGGVREL